MKLKSLVDKIIAEQKKYQSLMFNHTLHENVVRRRLNEESDTNKREDVL